MLSICCITKWHNSLIRKRGQAYSPDLTHKDQRDLMKPINGCTLQTAGNQTTNLSLLAPELLACTSQNKAAQQTIQVFDLETGEAVFTRAEQQPVSQVVGSETGFAYTCDKNLISYTLDQEALKACMTLLAAEHLELQTIIQALQKYAHGMPAEQKEQITKQIDALPERLAALKKNLHARVAAIPVQLRNEQASTACVVQ